MLTQEIVKEFLDYNPETGKLIWKKRDRKWFSSNKSYNTWNSRYADKEGFTSLDNRGYNSGRIFDKTYRSHRVIWLWMTGEWPRANRSYKS